MINIPLFDQVFERIGAAASFLDNAEKRGVVKSLRVLYFFPDEILRYLNELIDTNAADPGPIIAAGAKYAETEGDANLAIQHITSPSLVGNLKLTVEMIDELRHIADYKVGVRSLLNAIYITWMFEPDREQILGIAIQARDDIQYLNTRIRDLEREILPVKT
jgi:hypothetical protein